MRKLGLGQSKKTKEGHKRGLGVDRPWRVLLCKGGPKCHLGTLPLYPGGDGAHPGIFEGGRCQNVGNVKWGAEGCRVGERGST